MMNKLNLEIGKKVSILKSMELIPELYKGTIQGFHFGDYAQYKDCLYIYLKQYRGKRIHRIVISEFDTVFIFNGCNFDKAWNREKLSENHSTLHRITYNDVRDNKDLIYDKDYGQKVATNINDSYEGFIDMTASFMIDNGIKGTESVDNADYIDYIKQLITKYNFTNLVNYIKDEGYILLEKALNKSVDYAW